MPEVRLIDANALLKKCIEGDGDNKFTEGYNFAVQEISAYIALAPTIEAEPVRHGRWIKQENGLNLCSVCCVTKVSHLPFCGHCGAKMDGGADNG